MKNPDPQWLRTFVLSIGLFFLVLTPALSAPPPGYYLVWGDEFNGTSLDTTKWGYRLPGVFRDGYDTPNAISLNGSNLVITTYSVGGTNFTCELYTEKKFESKYGYWESNVKWSDSNGTWSAFWMLPPSQGYSAASEADFSDPQEAGSEIDICEHRYVDSSNVNNIANYIEVNLHWYDGSITEFNSPNYGNLPKSGGLATGFHTYGFLWTANAYSFLVDSVQVTSAPTAPVSHSTEYALLDTSVDDTSTTWAGYIPSGGYGSQATSATKMTVDYVRYYAPTNVLFWTGVSSAYWTDSANWISNLPPVSTSDLTFSYLSTTNLSMTPGQDYSIDGLIFLTSIGGFSINDTNTLTLGAGGVDMTAASQNITFNVPIIIGANQTWGVGLNRANNAGITLTENGNLSGSAALTKSCYGTLVLEGTNNFSGTLNVDTGSSSNNDGVLLIANSAAAGNVTSISIRNTGLGVSTLQLSNNVTLPQAISLAGRNTSVVPIEAVIGNNTITSGLTLTGGGSNYVLQCDTGTFNISGTVSAGSTATGPCTLMFQGNGSFSVAASIENGNSSPISVVKTNTGMLTLSGANTYTGGTINWRGTLFINGTLAGPLVVNGGALSGTGVVGGPTTVQSGCELSPGTAANPIGTLTFDSSLTLAAGSTTVMEINTASQMNDQVKVTGVLNCGGTLYVENLGGTLAPGQSFQLLNAGSYAGHFSALTLPPLDAGLAWNTNNLTNGILSVIAFSPPETLWMTNSGNGQIQLYWNYGTLQTATNVVGPYSYITNDSPLTIPMTNPEQFYRIREN